MNQQKFDKYLSPQRLSKYRAVCPSEEDAQELYKVNLNVSKSFYPLLSLFETFLRNAIDDELTTLFADPDWIINQKDSGGFMTKKANCALNRKVTEVQNKCTSQGVPATAGKIISEQSFGFWSRLFTPEYYGLIKGRVIRCFPNRPKKIQRKHIYRRLDEIRQLRNRIYHNEPVCFGNGCADFTEALAVRKHIHDLLEWMDVDALAYVQQFDDIDYQVNQWVP